MLKKNRKLIDLISKKIIKEEHESQAFHDRIENEIIEHKKSMTERRKSFSLLRNK